MHRKLKFLEALSQCCHIRESKRTVTSERVSFMVVSKLWFWKLLHNFKTEGEDVTGWILWFWNFNRKLCRNDWNILSLWSTTRSLFVETFLLVSRQRKTRRGVGQCREHYTAPLGEQMASVILLFLPKVGGPRQSSQHHYSSPGSDWIGESAFSVVLYVKLTW